MEYGHCCHARKCTVQVPRKMFMCRRHWAMLPKPLQRAVWREYNEGQENGAAEVTKAYLDVTAEAIAFIVELEKPIQGELF